MLAGASPDGHSRLEQDGQHAVPDDVVVALRRPLHPGRIEATPLHDPAAPPRRARPGSVRPAQAFLTVSVTLGQEAAIRVRAAFSVLSTLRPQRIFTATHSPT